MNSNPELPERLQSLLDSFVDEQDNVRNGILLVEGPEFKWKGTSGIAASTGWKRRILPGQSLNSNKGSKHMIASIGHSENAILLWYNLPLNPTMITRSYSILALP